MNVKELSNLLLCKEQKVYQRRRLSNSEACNNYDVDDSYITGQQLEFVLPDGTVCRDWQAVKKAVGKITPMKVQILPDTAELQLLCTPARYDGTYRLTDEERWELGEDADNEELQINVALDELALRDAIKITVTGSFTAVTSRGYDDLDRMGVGGSAERYQRRFINGRYVLTVLEIGDGFRTRRITFYEGDEPTSCVYYDAVGR